MSLELEVQSERHRNGLSQFYESPTEARKSTIVQPVKSFTTSTPLSKTAQSLNSYTHEDALKFASASTLVWKNSTKRQFPQLCDKYEVEIQCMPCTSEFRAYYRVVSEKRDGYILAACHVNVHGFHRGDLRLIEVNHRTVTRGTERQSCVGMLFLGDVIAVTGLALLGKFKELSVFDTTETCIWMASHITVQPRTLIENAVFSFLENKTAVVKEQSEVMNVKPSAASKFEVGRVYTGTAFVPEKTFTFYTSDHIPAKLNELIFKCSKIHRYPNALGTIFKTQDDSNLTAMFNIGTKAFKDTSYHLYQPSEVLETCVLMGYAAANSISNGRFDSRSFPMHNVHRSGPIVKFSIDNPADKPTEGKWTTNNRIRINGPGGVSNAVIETVIRGESKMLSVTARLSREVPYRVKFNDGIHIVSQSEGPEMQILKSGFFSRIPTGSNGRKIIEVLYGKPPEIYGAPWRQQRYIFPGIKARIPLNQYQCNYVDMLLDRSQIPMVVGSSPFGCGKSMTIVTAALEIYKKHNHQDSIQKTNKKKQLLVTQTNYASVNLVDIACKIQDKQGLRFVRYISEKNFKELATDCLTDYDAPWLMGHVFHIWATQIPSPFDKQCRDLKMRHKHAMLNLLFAEKRLTPEDLTGHSLRAHKTGFMPGEPRRRDLLEAFFMLYEPDVIMTTADSLQTLLNYRLLEAEDVISIQIDEASQVPEYTFISLLSQFPYANYGLIGDIQQLPPFCATGLDGKLMEYGIGNTMERAVKEKLFPQAMLRAVYRCHPEVTGLLSELFYDGELISGVPDNHGREFMERRSDFWPKSQYPVMVLNNTDRGYKMGTSCGNKTEIRIVKNLLEDLTELCNGYQLQHSNIGVISFYAAQTSILTEALRGQKVKCGTVDAFQGTERDVIILCCTNEKISEFMQLSNRINVAMSRAKQVTIIVGNLGGLKKAKYWGTIVKEAEENGCVVEVNSNGMSNSYKYSTNCPSPDRPKRVPDKMPTWQPRQDPQPVYRQSYTPVYTPAYRPMPPRQEWTFFSAVRCIPLFSEATDLQLILYSVLALIVLAVICWSSPAERPHNRRQYY